MQQMQQQAMMQQPQGRMPAGRMPPMAMGGSITGPTIQGQNGIAGLNMPGYAEGGGTVGSMRDNYKGSKGYDYETMMQTHDTVRQMNVKTGTVFQLLQVDHQKLMVVSWVKMVENNMESVHGSRKKLWILLKRIQ